MNTVDVARIVDFDDLVLSSVHVGKSADSTACLAQAPPVTTFIFEVVDRSLTHSKFEKAAQNVDDQCYDEDGDFIVKRRNCHVIEERQITLYHCMATPLAYVGKQIWLGSLLLSDWILHNPSLFKDACCLEVGAGVGLCSILAGMLCRQIFCTDVGESILSICQKNVEQNVALLKYGRPAIKVRELDWLTNGLEFTESNNKCNRFSWTCHDTNDLKHVGIFLAADVIYEDTLTDALFKKIVSLMRESELREVQLFISVEKRLNFTIDKLDVACPAYDHFREKLTALESGQFEDSCREHKVRRIDTTFPKYLDYERPKELELWQVMSTRG